MEKDRLFDSVEWQLDDRVALITLDRPDAGNGIDEYLARGLKEAADRVFALGNEGRLRAAVLRASGKVFTVGGDLNAFAAPDDRGSYVSLTAELLHTGLLTLTRSAVPVVSVVHGTAAGGGVGIALSADIVLVSDDAKLVLAYTAAGLTPDCGSTWILPQLIGLPRALDLALTNRAITGATALEWGLASRAVPREQLEDTLAEVLDGLRRASFPAVSRTKQLMRAASGRDRAEALDAEAASIATVINGPDGIEGVDAFLAKRTPQFD